MAGHIFKLLLFHHIVFGFSYGSTINLSSSPDTIQPFLTPTLTLICEVDNSISISPSGQLVGRDVTSTADDLLVLTSIVIVRNSNEHVAKVTIVTPAEALVDLHNLEANGSLTRNNGVSGFLKLTWDFPSSAQIGNYSCEASGVDAQGHNVMLTEATTVNEVQPTMDDLVSHLLNLTLAVRSQQQQIIDLKRDHQQEITDLKNGQQNMIAEMQRNNSALVSRLTHSETGIVNVGSGSYNWTVDEQKTVHFAKSYDQAPVVHLATNGLNQTVGGDTVLCVMELVSVSTTGFVFNYSTFPVKGYDIDLWISWLSVPH